MLAELALSLVLSQYSRSCPPGQVIIEVRSNGYVRCSTSVGSAGSVAWSGITGKPATFPATVPVATATALAADPTDCAAGQYATAIAANGNLTCAALPGGVWNDLQVSVTQGVGAAALSTATIRDTPARIPAMSSVGADTITFYAQMPHGWGSSTNVMPHVHWVPLSVPAAARVVRFKGQYTWADPQAVIPANASWTTFTVDVALGTGDAYFHKISPLATVAPGTAPAPSSVLVVHLIRDGSSSADTYTDSGPANVGILSLDVHYKSNNFGSATEY